MAKWRIVLWAAIVLAALGFFYAVRGILLPFVLAWVIAVLLDPVVHRMRLRGVPRGVAVVVIGIAFFVAVGGLAAIAAPRVAMQVNELRGSIESLAEQLAQENRNDSFFVRWNPVVRAEPPGPLAVVDRSLEQFRPVLQQAGLPSTRRAILDQYVIPHQREIGQAVQRFFSGFVGALGGAFSQLMMLFFTPIFALLFLGDMERMRLKSASWIPPMIRKDTMALLREIGDVFTCYLRGVAINTICYMTLMSLLLSALGVPYAVLLAIVMAAFYIVPTLGGIINGVMVFLVCWLSGQSSNWFMHFGSPLVFAIVVVAALFVVGTLYDTLINPRILGKSVGLNPLVSLFVIFSGGALFGVIGMIVSIPLAGAVKVALDRLIKLTTAPTPDMLHLPAVPLRHRQTAGG